MPRPQMSLRERLLSRLIIDPSGCLLWTGKIGRDGYGRISVAGTSQLVHRVAWQIEYGPIPRGLVMDHVRALGCSHRHCANIAHLEPVTIHENLLRSGAASVRNATKTHCEHGHGFTPENTYTDPRGWRQCRTCGCAAQARKKARRGATP